MAFIFTFITKIKTTYLHSPLSKTEIDIHDITILIFSHLCSRFTRINGDNLVECIEIIEINIQIVNILTKENRVIVFLHFTDELKID